jgi:DNA-binding transcriptional ArsR family regulator
MCWEAPRLTVFEPDQITLELLQAEHVNGTWVGLELLPIASRIWNQGGSEDDYRRWVLVSTLWQTYTGSTSDSRKKQHTGLDSAWDKAAEAKPFDLEESLSALRERIAAHNGWAGRTGSRDRAVALALVEFCIEHNCFTRTLSSYELAKWTAGISQPSVSRALTALADHGLIRTVERTDRRTSERSTRRYRLNLQWGVSNIESRSTGKASLIQELTPPSDLWSRGGLGLGAQRVFETLSDEPVAARSIADQTGMKPRGVKRYLGILAEHCLAGSKPGARGEPTLYFRVDTPLDAVADSMGIYGHVEIKRWEIERRQHSNRAAYPSSYRPLTESDNRI